METKRLYFDDPYETDFEAQILSRVDAGGRPAVVLNQTCFYPESGGQPADLGTIEDANVLDVIEDDQRILHILDREVAGSRVRGRVDWPRRFDHMQQHTGQHILSQSFGEVLKGETHSFHLAEGISTLEIGLEKVSEEEVEKIELAANAVVFEDREVRTYFVPQERLGDIPLRRPAKKQGTIRVVEISCFDYSACGGTHCRRTGEVGLIKIIRWERIRNHVRFDFLCGGRALSDFVRKNRNLRLLANRLSVNEQDIPAALEKLSVEAKALQKKGRRLEEDLLLYEAREMARSAQGSIIKSFLTDKGPTEGRKLALNLIRQGEFHVLFGLRSEGKVHFVFARSGDRGLDLRELVGLVTSLIPAKGGGSPSLVEIVAEESVDAVDVLDRAAVFLKTRLG